MQIDIFSDVICPWCFIGKRKLERALAEAGVDDASITWRAFQLNPDMPPQGMDRREYLETKFGGARRADEFYARIADAGREVGIDFAFDRIPRTPNTVDAHRLIRRALDTDSQGRLVDALFDAYFLNGENIADPRVLARLGIEAGLSDNADTLVAWLAGDAQAEEVREEDRQARELGISGVPCFIFDRRYAVSGAQPVEVFRQVFDEVGRPQTASA